MHIGNDVIIGAGSVVKKDITNGSVAVGNPARVICSIEDYIEKRKEQMSSRPVYDASWTIDKIKPSQMSIMKNALEEGIGFVE